MLLNVVNLENEKVGQIEVSDEIFGAEVRPHLHWEMVRYQMAKKRRGTHATRTRGEITGSTRKLYRQKGTGRARHGDIKAPIFVGGGTVHGPKPRNYALKTPRKVRRGALCSVLSELVRDGRITVVDSFSLNAPRTKDAAGALAKLGAGRSVVVDGDNQNLALSVRNLPTNKYLRVEGVNVYDLLRYEHLVITREALDALNGVLQK